MDWHEPIKGVKNVKETPFSLDGVHTEVSLEVTSHRDMHMLERGLACTNCLTTFPAVPEKRNIRAFEPEFDKWPIPREVMRARVLEGACYVCGMYINPEAIAKQITNPGDKPKPVKREYEGLPGDTS